LTGRSSDRISVGLDPSDHSNAPSNEGQLTSQYLDFWIYDSTLKRPYYEHRGEIIARSDADFTKRMPSIAASKVPSVAFSSVVGRKQPFAAFIMETKTASESLYPVPAFLTTGTSRLSSQVGNNPTEFMNERLEYKIETISGFDSDLLQVTLLSHPAGPDHGYIGSGRGPATGQTNFLFSSIPSDPPTSLAQFRHAGTGDGASVIRATNWGFASTPNSPYADQAIGNSYAHPMLESDTAVKGNLLDNRYLANEALWDRYFLSSLAPQGASRFGDAKSMKASWSEFVEGKSELINSRFRRPHDSAETKLAIEDVFGSGDLVAPDAYKKIAAHLMLEGGFNVNSTSVDAWHAILASTREMSITQLPLTGKSGAKKVKASGSLYSRTNIALAGSADGDPNDLSSHYSGFRDLSNESLRELAEKVVEQVRLRGPFLNLGEFVNRRLSRDPDLALSGALQTAIDGTGLNRAIGLAGVSTSGAPGGVSMPFPEASKLGSAAGNPGWLMQGDVLDPLGPSIVVRGDTFRIRGYGSAKNQAGEIASEAWCEAVVQRSPGYVDPSENAVTHPPAKPLNRQFGRGFDLVSFRWLKGPDE
jgi:hypothetical protein